MNEIEDLTETERMLLMAAAVVELGPKANLCNANTFKVVRQAGLWLGMSAEEVRAAVYEPDAHPTMRKVYDTLIGLTSTAHHGKGGHAPERPGEPLFEGNGNWGQPGASNKPASDPLYNSCRLTDYGERIARQLLEQYPEYRKSR